MVHKGIAPNIHLNLLAVACQLCKLYKCSLETRRGSKSNVNKYQHLLYHPVNAVWVGFSTLATECVFKPLTHPSGNSRRFQKQIITTNKKITHC